MLERSKVSDPCSPSVVTVGAQQGVRPVQPVGCHCWSAARYLTCAARGLTLSERSEVSDLCSLSNEVTVVYRIMTL